MKLRVYGDMLSGNCYKVKLLMQWLGLEHAWLLDCLLSHPNRNEVIFTDDERE